MFQNKGDEMKLFIIAVSISLMCLSGFARSDRGGDMPFPIGKIVDFPKDDGKGIWKDELKKKIFRLRPLKGVLPDGEILVQMLALQKKVIAEGIGEIGPDKVLRARLQYLSNAEKIIEVKIVNLCADAEFDSSVNLSEVCKETEMWASMTVQEKDQKFKGAEQFVIKKYGAE